MSQPEVWTVGRLLQWTTDYLKQHQVDSPRLDAEVLLAESLGCRRIELYTTFDDVPGEKPRTAFRDLVRQRAAGKPVAYLVGRREFYSLSFRVTPDVLIPRPETELLVVTLLDLAKGRASSEPILIADVGTGSGIIAVCVAKHLPGCRVAAIDISPAALAVARTNAAEHHVEDRIEWIESDLFAAVDPQRRFDFVVSNPPYVSSARVGEPGPGREELRAPRGPGGRSARDRGDRGPDSAGRRASEARRTPADRDQPDDPRRRRPAVGRRAAVPGPTVKDLARLPRVVQATTK